MRTGVVTTKGPTTVEVTLLWADLPRSFLSTQIWVVGEILHSCRFQVLGEIYGSAYKRWRVDCVRPLDDFPPAITSGSLAQLKSLLNMELEKVVMMPVTNWSHELIDTGAVV